MNKSTCSTPECNNQAKVRGMCMPHYHRARRSGEIQTADRNTYSPRHTLTAVDVEAKTAICSVCGPTTVLIRAYNGSTQCMTVRRRHKKQYPSPHNREVQRKAWLLRRYGITTERYEAMIEAQGGRCATCGTCDPGGHGTWHVDHDHNCCPGSSNSCGDCVRGLLCHYCNTALGSIRDNIDTLRQMIDYLDANTRTLKSVTEVAA